MPFEVFEHTADIGLHMSASTLEELFTDAGRGIVALVVENPDAVEPRQQITIVLEAEGLEELFVDWLRELIYRFETQHLLLREFAISISPDARRLRADCRGETADWSRHLPDNELKAVTYHQLRVARTPSGWEADVILDI